MRRCHATKRLRATKLVIACSGGGFWDRRNFGIDGHWGRHSRCTRAHGWIGMAEATGGTRCTDRCRRYRLTGSRRKPSQETCSLQGRIADGHDRHSPDWTGSPGRAPALTACAAGSFCVCDPGRYNAVFPVGAALGEWPGEWAAGAH